jgi:hypothetical protein
MKITAWLLAGLGLATLVIAIVVLKDFRATLGGSLLFGASALISRGQSTVHLPVMSRPVQSAVERPIQARHPAQEKSA